jgi:hypothetical protein
VSWQNLHQPGPVWLTRFSASRQVKRPKETLRGYRTGWRRDRVTRPRHLTNVNDVTQDHANRRAMRTIAPSVFSGAAFQLAMWPQRPPVSSAQWAGGDRQGAASRAREHTFRGALPLRAGQLDRLLRPAVRRSSATFGSHVKSFAHSCLLCLASVAPWSHAAAPDPSLMGCWRAVKIVLSFQDGSKAEDTSGRCTLQFSEDQFKSACETGSRTATTTYQYRIVRPNFYEATMTGSTFQTDLIGSTREYEYHVDGDRLVTAPMLRTRLPAPPTVATRVESEAARMPCQ